MDITRPESARCVDCRLCAALVVMLNSVERQTQTTCGLRGSRIRRGPGFQKQLMDQTRNCRDDLGQARFTGSYAENRYNGLNSFIFTNAQGQDRAVRWSFGPAAVRRL